MKNEKNSIETRMKGYEACYETRIPARTYTIIRLDGKNFSNYTKMFEKPFDDLLSNAIDAACIELGKYLHPKFIYTQSDEISILLTDIENIDSELAFNGKVQKLCSISASKFTAAFNKTMLKLISLFKYSPEELISKIYKGDLPEIDAVFDARVFIIPDFREVSNYFIWRQQDCSRNSVSMAASANFSHESLKGKSGREKQEMLFNEKGINWDSYLTKYKRGVVIKKQEIWVEGANGESVQRSKWLPDYDIPVFTQDKEYLYKLIPIIQ